MEKISIAQTMEKAHKVLEYCAAKSKDDVFQTSRVSKFFAEQTFKAIILKISDNYSDVLSNGPLNQTCRQFRVQMEFLEICDLLSVKITEEFC